MYKFGHPYENEFSKHNERVLKSMKIMKAEIGLKGAWNSKR